MQQPARVVIVGGGFGGIAAALALRKSAFQTTLVDRRNFHLFQPLLYQVATGTLSPANIATPLRRLLKPPNADVVLGEVLDFDLRNRRVILRHDELEYDYLIVAAGARYNYFGHDEWETTAPGLKSIEDATEIRARILLAFESADRSRDPDQRNRDLTFVIVGGGPTGVELAGALAETARYTLRNEFYNIDPREANIILVEGLDRILQSFPPNLSNHAERKLARLGVQIRLNSMVTDVRSEYVRIESGGNVDLIRTRNVLWTAGVRAVPLSQRLAAAAGVEPDRAGRIIVGPECSVPGFPNVFVIGDMAAWMHNPDRRPLPRVAPVALQQGRYVARRLIRQSRGKPTPPFHYHDLGTMATVGRGAAVVNSKWVQINGFIAWLIWLFVHLMKIVSFENRVLVLIQWGWHYLTFNRSARLITEYEFARTELPQATQKSVLPADSTEATTRAHPTAD